MKIKSLKFQNHPLFGNLSLNFCDPSGKPYDFIVLAGENGTGKTQLLEIIFGFSKLQNNFAIAYTEFVLGEFEIDEFQKSEIIKNKLNKTNTDLFYNYMISDKIIFSLKPHEGFGYSVFIPKEYLNNAYNSDLMFNTPELLQSFFYSPVDSNFSIGLVAGITSKILDKKEVNETRQGSSIGQEMNQLFVDISNQDFSDLGRWVDNNDGIAPPESIKSQRIKRFRLAFQKILPNKIFVGSHNNNGTFKSMFKFGDHEIPLENLSHGEKQIILRSGFILRNQNAAKGSIILIDEIEMGLHPALQERILEYYADLVKFPDYQNQVIVTTHSPFTVHNQMQNLKVIILKNQDGQVVIDENPTFAKLAPREIVAKAFQVSPLTRPTLITEGKTDVKILITAWSKLFTDQPMPFEIRESGIGENSGTATGTRMAIERISEFIPNFPVVGLLDNDDAGVKEFNGLSEKHGFIASKKVTGLKSHKSSPAHLLVLPVIPLRDQFVNDEQTDCYLTIEHYFSDEILDKNGLKGQKYRITGTKIFSIIDSKKVHFAENVIQHLDTKEFMNFRQLFETIAKILNVQI